MIGNAQQGEHRQRSEQVVLSMFVDDATRGFLILDVATPMVKPETAAVQGGCACIPVPAVGYLQ